MPSVRSLAAEILVNPNTVAKVYRELEREKLLKARPGSGVLVATGAAKRARRTVHAELKFRLSAWLEEARDVGLADELLQEILVLGSLAT